MLHAAIMSGVKKSRKNYLTQERSSQRARKPSIFIPEDNVKPKPRPLVELKAELTYNDLSNFYKKRDTVAKRRSIARYGGAKTDTQLIRPDDAPRQQPIEEQKLYRRESIIASWDHLKKEKERALGKNNGYALPPAIEIKPGNKVKRTQSAKENSELGRYSSKRKSVIYSYDPEKKILNERYNYSSDESKSIDGDGDSMKNGSVQSSKSSLDSIKPEFFPCQKSSSLDKIKYVLSRVFGNTKTH